MGFLDDLTETLNRGASVTAKTANVLKLKAQIADLNSQRRNLCSGLGAALYDRTKGDTAFTSGLEDFYNGIANCDERIAGLQKQVEEVEAQGPVRPGRGSRYMKSCATCGFSLSASDVFCSRCGTPVPHDSVANEQSAQGPQQPGSGSAAETAPQSPYNQEPIDVNPC